MGTISSIRETKPASVGGVPQQSINNINNNINNINNYQQSQQYQPSGIGMQPTGTWINQRTGELVTVDNMVNDLSQNGSQVILSTGELISFSEFARDYVQIDESENIDNNNQVQEVNLEPEEHEFSLDEPLTNVNNANNTNNIIIPEDNITLVPEINNINNISKEKQMIIDLIDNLASSRSRKPSVEISSVEIKNLPKEALSSLIKYFNVSVDDIVDIIFDKLVDKNIIKKCITDYIDDIKSKTIKK